MYEGNEVPACPTCNVRKWTRPESATCQRDLEIKAGLSNTITDGLISGFEWQSEDDWHGYLWRCANGHIAPDGELYEQLNDLVEGY